MNIIRAAVVQDACARFDISETLERIEQRLKEAADQG